MACRGAFLAITAAEADALFRNVGDDDALSDMANMLGSDEGEAAGLQAGVDKAWDAMHRCLGDGLLNDIGEGSTLLSRFVLGGKNLYLGDSYIICYVTADEVPKIAAAAEQVTKTWMHTKYFALDPNQYDGPMDDQDWEYTWDYFEEARKVYTNAAKAGRAVIFIVDQ